MKHKLNSLNKKDRELVVLVIKTLLYGLINIVIWEFNRPHLNIIQVIFLFISSVYIMYIALDFRYRWG